VYGSFDPKHFKRFRGKRDSLFSRYWRRDQDGSYYAYSDMILVDGVSAFCDDRFTVEGKEHDIGVDVWSLGILLRHVWHPPFEAKKHSSMYKRYLIFLYNQFFGEGVSQQH